MDKLTEEQIALYRNFLNRKIDELPYPTDAVKYAKYRENTSGPEFPDSAGNYLGVPPDIGTEDPPPFVEATTPEPLPGTPKEELKRPGYLPTPIFEGAKYAGDKTGKVTRPIVRAAENPLRRFDRFIHHPLASSKSSGAPPESALRPKEVSRIREAMNKFHSPPDMSSREMPLPAGHVTAQEAAHEEVAHANAARVRNDFKAEQEHLGEALKYDLTARHYLEYGQAQEKNKENAANSYVLAQITSYKPGSAGVAKFSPEELRHMRETIVANGGAMARYQLALNEKIQRVASEFVRRGINPEMAVDAASQLVFTKEVWKQELQPRKPIEVSK